MSKISSKDNFEEIYDLTREGLYDDGLKMLIEKSTGHLNKDYLSDENHAWYLVGDIYYKKNEYEKAIDAFKKSLRSRSDDIEAMWALSNCYMDLTMPRKSEDIIRKALKISNKQELIYNLANSLFDQERYDEALKYYNKVTQDNDELYDLAQKNIHHIKKKNKK